MTRSLDQPTDRPSGDSLTRQDSRRRERRTGPDRFLPPQRVTRMRRISDLEEERPSHFIRHPRGRKTDGIRKKENERERKDSLRNKKNCLRFIREEKEEAYLVTRFSGLNTA